MSAMNGLDAYLVLTANLYQLNLSPNHPLNLCRSFSINIRREVVQ
jgi:hypothetical protein